ncbi:MAG: sodium-independent anion transporter [Acidobacteria bacterium]|nr:MAG: sodium-independent anion transporter [Acidobacteriota bacterium]
MAMLNWLADYKKDWFSADLIAGLTTAAVVIPKAMAYATIAGLPVEIGLYTAFLPMIIYAFLGTSRVLSVSTTTTIAILTAAQLGHVVPNGDAAALQSALVTLTILVGGILILSSILRLGFVANFISEPVLIGFKAGIGVVIVVDQIPKLLGIHFDKGSFIHNVFAIFGHLPEVSMPTLLVGVVMIVLLVGIEHISPKAPAPLIAVAVGIAGMSFLHLNAYGVSAVGAIPRGLPSLRLPDLTLAVKLWPGAMGIALMSFTETIAAGRAFAKDDEPVPSANRELFATGLANAGGAILGSMPAGGGTSQTAVNRLAGARSQLSELVTAGGTLLTMLLLAPLVAKMPNATLAAVVIVYSLGLIKPIEFRAILNIRRMEFIWALAAFAGVVLLGTLQGIVVAIIVSLLALAYQVADPPVYVLGRKPGTNIFRPLSKEHPEDETFPGLLLLLPEGRIFFANAEIIQQKARELIEEAKPKIVAFDFRAVPDLEYTALKMIIDAEKRLRNAGILIWLVGLNPQVLAVIQRSSLGETLGRERMKFNLESAVEQYLQNKS